MEIWVNPRCSKCQSAMSMLDEAGAQYTVRRYLQDPPTSNELAEVLGLTQHNTNRAVVAAGPLIDLRPVRRCVRDRKE